MGFARTALAVLFVAASCSAEHSQSARSDVTPMQKVIEILNNMLQKGQADKHAEQVQYAAFKQFCDDTGTEKQRSIAEGKQLIERLQADIQSAETDAEILGQEMQKLDAEVATLNGDLKASTRVRELEAADYAAGHKDYTESIDAIAKAIQVLKTQAYNRPQVTSLLEGVTSLAKVPEAAKRKVEAFLSKAEDDPLQEDLEAPESYGYEFRSSNIIDMLEKLQDKFTEERTALEKDEMNKKHAFQLLSQDLQASIQAAENTRSAKQLQRSNDLQSAADMKGELTDAQSTLTDDTKYLNELDGSCRQKASDFTTRQELRTEEIATIQKAIEILSSDDVQGAAERHLPTMIQKKASMAQLRSSSSSRVSDPNQMRAAEYLNAQAEHLGSRTLAVLATKAGEDPFGKVKKMIQDLIMRLQEQGTEEMEHKGWCDKELAENEIVRTTRTDQVERYRTLIDEYTSSIAKDTQQAAELQADVADLQTAMNEQTEMRNQDKAKNEATIADAQAAQQALTRAIEMLRTFYAEAGEATALVQGGRKQAPEAPAIFDAPYQGMGAESGGVVGILEVVHSDFARLEAETQAQEVTSRTDFERFMTDSSVDKAQKDTTIKHLATKKAAEEQRVVELNTDLSMSQKELDAANNYYDSLKPSCLNAGTTFEERNARRQEEIQSLQEALRILNGEDLAGGEVAAASPM